MTGVSFIENEGSEIAGGWQTPPSSWDGDRENWMGIFPRKEDERNLAQPPQKAARSETGGFPFPILPQ